MFLEVFSLWMRIELRSPLSVYEQIKVGIKEAIMLGGFERDSQLPSIRELAKDIQVNPNTVVRAYRELENEGIIFSRPGIGFVVTVDKAGIKEKLMEDFEAQLEPLLKRIIKMGISKDDINEVVERLWKKERSN